MRLLILLVVLSSVANAALVGPDYYKVLITAEAGAATVETVYKVSVTTTINDKPEPARVRAFGKGRVMAGEGDTVGGQPVVLKLSAGGDYRIEAYFPRVSNTASKIIDDLSGDMSIDLNLEYYTVQVSSRQGNRPNYTAAGTIRVYDRGDQAHPIASGHTNGYDPVAFFLEARRGYVFTIAYDDRQIRANFNGRVLYELKRDTGITFNF